MSAPLPPAPSPAARRARPRRNVHLLVGAGAVLLFSWPAVSGRVVYWRGDLSTFMVPLLGLLGECIRTADFRPLAWNARLFAGYPLLAEGQMGAYYPLNWLVAVVPAWLFPTLSIVFSHALTVFATVRFARLLGMSVPAALLSALAFAYGGFVVGHVPHLHTVAAVPWLPVVLWWLEAGFRKRRAACWLLAGAAWAAQWLTGHPQVPLMTGAVAALWMASHALRGGAAARDAAVAAGLMVAVTAGLAAVYFLPLHEVTQASVRGSGTPAGFEAADWALAPSALSQAFLPFARGGPRSFGPGPFFEETALYVGVITLACAALAPCGRRRRRHVLFFLATAGLAVLLALGRATPLHDLAAALPGVGSLRVPARWLFVADFAVAILAGFGLDWVTRRSPRARRVGLLAAAAALAGAVAVATLLETGADHTRLAVLLALTSSFLVGAVGAPAPAWRWLAVAILAADLRPFVARVHGAYQVPPSEAVVREPAVEHVARAAGGSRFLRHPRLDPSNSALALGAYDLGGYNSLPLQRHWAYLERAGTARNGEERLLAAGAARFFVAPADWSPPPAPEGAVGDAVVPLRPVFRLGGSVVYENPAALPRTWAVHEVRRVRAGDALAALRDPAWSPARTVVVDDPSAPAVSGALPSTVTLERDDHTRLSLLATMQADGYVVLADAYYPGWEADVDGRPTPVYPANQAFRAVFVPAGEHRVSFVLDTGTYRTGALISLLTLGGASALLLRARRPRGQRATAAGTSSGATACAPSRQRRMS